VNSNPNSKRLKPRVSGAQMKLPDEKTRGRKSSERVPIKNVNKTVQIDAISCMLML
jgi:hypothetical protein